MEEGKKYRWYVIYTRPRHEKKLAQSYEEIGIHYYLPLVKTLKQWSDRKKKVEEVLFKSYIFVYVSEIEYYLALKEKGALRYISIKGKPVYLTQNQMDSIKNTIDNNLEFDLSSDYFMKGKQIIIKKGPLKGANGEIVTSSGKRKLLIRINEIGYSLFVHLSPDDLV